MNTCFDIPSDLLSVRRNREGSRWTYSDLDHCQRQIAKRVREGGRGTFLLSELAPVITLGRRTPSEDILQQTDPLSQIPVYQTDRGGLATYHGPGQWVLFPVFSLQSLTGDPRGVRAAVEALLEIALQVGRIYEPRAEIRKGAEMGVWSRRGKFAAVGIYVQDGVLLHGLSLNGFRTAQSFQGLRPCGLDAPVDFLLGGDLRVASDLRKSPDQGMGSAPRMDSGLGMDADPAHFENEFLNLGKTLAETTIQRWKILK